MFAIVIIIIAGLWDIDFENMASMGVGAQFAGRFLEMLMIIATGYLVWEVVTLLINRRLAAEQTAEGFDLSADEPGGGEGGGQGGSRLSTVLPMVRFTLQLIIATMTILIALGNIGVDTTPIACRCRYRRSGNWFWGAGVGKGRCCRHLLFGG